MVMRQMRQNTKIIMLVTALAFVALMVFEWGMDASGRTGGGTLGRVGGTAVSVEAYQNTYNSLYEQAQRSQAQAISTAQNRELEEMAWTEVVNQILIQNELVRRGIRVSDEEILEAAQFSPPPQFQSDPAFLNEAGQFDLARYREYLGQAGQDPVFLQQLEQYYREVIPRDKLARQVTSGIFVSDAELWERWRATREEAEVTALVVDPELRIPDSAVEVTDSEVEDYYRANREEFDVPARAQVRYVYMDMAPTAADTASVLARAEAARDEIRAGAAFAEVARRLSDDPGTAELGGEMGSWGRGELIEDIEEVAFALPVGEVSDPIATPFGYHLLDVTAREEDEAGEERVTVRHILFEVRRTDESEIGLFTQADSLESLASRVSFEEAAQQFGLEIRTGEITEEAAFLDGVGSADDAQDWIFLDQEGPGAVSPLFESVDAFYMVEILGQEPAGTLTLDEVADEIERQLRSQRKAELALEELTGWAQEIRGGSVTLEALSERVGIDPVQTGTFTRQDLVPELGLETPAVGAAFGGPVGEVVGPFRADQGRLALIRVDERTEPSREVWEAQREAQRMQVTAEIQQERLGRWVEGLRETTRIIDNREEFFRAAEEAAEQAPAFGGGFGF
ncbi:MAG: peptidyl-prolyl cis-trans isomerase [Gemmatimonadota bacterium]